MTYRTEMILVVLLAVVATANTGMLAAHVFTVGIPAAFGWFFLALSAFTAGLAGHGIAELRAAA